MVRSVVLVCLGVLSVASAAAAQVPPPPPPPPGSTMTFGDGSQADAAPTVGTGAISGVVTDGTTGAPIAGALIQLVGGAGQSGARPRQMTDAKGRFIFTQLPAFRDYTLVASPVGYLDGGYRRPARRRSSEEDSRTVSGSRAATSACIARPRSQAWCAMNVGNHSWTSPCVCSSAPESEVRTDGPQACWPDAMSSMH